MCPNTVIFSPLQKQYKEGSYITERTPEERKSIHANIRQLHT
jgi:hypothetical protein